jgi:D-glycero-alpha-D-manno-heptose-7-phosphate kinase
VLIARAPFRISLAGGGTDLPSYYEQYGGLVVSAAINKYFYVFISPDGDGPLEISSADYQMLLRHNPSIPVDADSDLKHVRTLLNHFGITKGYSIFLASQVPPGTGLGSSSALAVALSKAIATIRSQPMNNAQIAETACLVELDILKMPIGRQDQYAAAFGGINRIRFERDGVKVDPLRLSDATLNGLRDRLLLFFTKISHDSSQILQEQTRSNQNGSNLEPLHEIKRLALEMGDALETGHLDRVGAILHESWERKKRLAKGISTGSIDGAYEAAVKKGASGGKITGAGGGGFLLLYCEPEKHAPVIAEMEHRGFVPMSFDFDFAGARVLVNHST